MGLPALATSDAPKGRTVMVFGPKGGVGKTTISCHLLVSAAQKNYRVLGIDFDPQRSLSLWSEARSRNSHADQLAMFDHAPASLKDWMAVWDHVNEYDLVVMDMPPGIEGDETSLFSIASRVDYIIMPTGQGDMDLVHMIPWMVRFRERNIKAVFCLNKVIHPNWTSAKQAKAELCKHGHLVPVDIPLREDIYQTGSGIAAVDHAKMKGYSEFEILWNHVSMEVGL